jgi:hypothetical protein
MKTNTATEYRNQPIAAPTEFVDASTRQLQHRNPRLT